MEGEPLGLRGAGNGNPAGDPCRGLPRPRQGAAGPV